MARKPPDGDAETASVANVQEPKKATKASKAVSKRNTALEEKRSGGVRIRIKDTGAIAHVGWKTGEELVACGRAEVVDDE